MPEGSARYSDDFKADFIARRRLGESNDKLCDEIGINRKTGQNWWKSLRYMERKDGTGLPKPKTRSQIRAHPAGRKALDDFAYFRLVVFGHKTDPWELDAAERIRAAVEAQRQEYIVINVFPGAGKALALDTPIATPNGWTTMGELRPGDTIFGGDGKPCRVVFKSEVFHDHDCYEVTSDDGASVVADADHLWPVRIGGNGQYNGRFAPDRPGKPGPKPSPDGKHLHTTEWLYRRQERGRGGKRPQLAVAPPLDLPDIDLPVDPYVLGVWLGDGNSRGATITSAPDDAKHLRAYIEEAGYTTWDTKDPIQFGVGGTRKWARDGLQTQLRALGLLRNKHVPEEYLRASPAQRFALLQGLIDTDGHVSPRGMVEFTTTSRQLAVAAAFLARSLGAKASMREGRTQLYGRDCGPRWRVVFYLSNAARLPRKAVLCRDGARTPHRYLSIRPVPSVPTQCIQVDSPDRCYLAGEGLLVTHNTELLKETVCWLIARDRTIRIIWGSASDDLATMRVSQIRMELTRSVPGEGSEEDIRTGRAVKPRYCMAELFGRFRPSAVHAVVWKRDEFTVAQPGKGRDDEGPPATGPTLQAFGRKSKQLGARAEFIVWDDAWTEEDEKNPETGKSTKKWLDRTAENRLQPHGVFCVVMQKMSANDLSTHCLAKQRPTLDEEGRQSGWEPLYQRIVYPAHHEDLCDGAHPAGRPAWDPNDPQRGRCMTDPMALPPENMLAKMQEPTWQIVYQQLDIDPTSALIREVYLTGGVDEDGVPYPGCLNLSRRLMEPPPGVPKSKLISAAAIDPGQERRWGLYWSLTSNDPAEDREYVMHALSRAMPAGTDKGLLDWIHSENRFVGVMNDWQVWSEEIGYPILAWVVEINAAQRHLLRYDFVTRWQRLHKVKIIPHSTGTNKVDPARGVEALLPSRYQHGAYDIPWFPGETQSAMTDLKNEATHYQQNWSDDLLMAQWMLRLNIKKVSRPVSVVPSRDDVPEWVRRLA